MKRAIVIVLCLAAGSCGNDNSTSDGGSQGCTQFGSVCLFPPNQPAQRTPCGEVTDFCDTTGKTAPVLGCLTTPPAAGPATPATVSLTGFVDVFSSGPDSKGVSIAVFDAAPLFAGGDPAAQTPIASVNVSLDPATQRGCDAEAKDGCSLPSASGCALPLCNDGLGGRPDDKKYCRDNGNGDTTCNDRLRWEARYTLANIPTNKHLVIRTSGPNGMPDQTWATLYIWNVYLATNAPACKDNTSLDCIDLTNPASPSFQLNVNALSQSDYVNIPVTSGLAGGISPGQGGVAGEVRDCDNVRLSNVAVGVTPSADRFTYFNGNPIKTLPDSSRISFGTGRIGLYAALNAKPGKVLVESAGSLTAGGPLTSFGSFEAFIYPDSVAVLNLNAGHPKP